MSDQGGPSAGRVFSDEELAAAGRSPWLAATEALGAGQLEEAQAQVARAEANFEAQLQRYTGWLGSVTMAVSERWGQEGGAMLAVASRQLFATSPDLDATGAEDPPSFVQRIAGTEPAESGALLPELEAWFDRWRHTIDLHRDWISALLGAVYRAHGPDALEVVLRVCGAQGLMAGVEQFNRQNPRDRLVKFVSLLHGHFAELTLAEDDRMFTITQDPCGTCTRQITDGRMEPPMDLAVVQERHRTTWGRGNTSVYRSHVPIWHVEMAREHFGVPWPVNQCPSGLDGRPCRILLFKEPYDPAANDLVPSADNPF